MNEMPVERLQHHANPINTVTGEFPELPRAMFRQALKNIQNWQGYAPTPLHGLDKIAADYGLGEVAYKHEGPRFGLGSFKALGGAYAVEVLNQDRDGQTFVTATDSNHGRSVAWGAHRVSAPCRIYIHNDVSPYRERAIAHYGADVIRVEGDYDDAVTQCRADAKDNGWTIVSDTSWDGYSDTPRYVMAGYGVMVEELKTQMDQPPTHVFLQGGVGAFAAAMVAALHYQYPGLQARFISVEPVRAPCLFESAKAGRAVSARVEHESIMAGLSCGEASPLAWRIMSKTISDFVLIPDAIIPPTIRQLASLGIEGGESGVSGLAALIAICEAPDIKSQMGLGPSSRILLFGTEGITDPEIYQRVIDGKI